MKQCMVTTTATMPHTGGCPADTGIYYHVLHSSLGSKSPLSPPSLLFWTITILTAIMTQKQIQEKVIY